MSDRTGERYWEVSEEDKLRRIEMIDRFIEQHRDIIEGYEAERAGIVKELLDDKSSSIGQSALRQLDIEPPELHTA